MTPFPSKIPHPLFSFSTNDLFLLKGLYTVYTTILLLEIVIQMQFVIFFFFFQDLYCCLTSWLFQAQVEQRLEQGASNLEAN